MASRTRLPVLLLCSAVATQGQLTPDQPWGLPAGSVQYLTTAAGTPWTLASATHGLTLPATVPGDVVTDLQTAGLITDPYYELGWLNSTTPGAQGAPLWDTGAWVYSANFTASPAILAALAAGGTPYLIADGLKMAADVAVNGLPLLPVVNDQWLRFAFALPPALLLAGPGANAVALTFSTSRDARNAEGRFSGASGGWDWGPYTSTDTGARQAGGGTQHTFSKGAWRDVYLAVASAPAPAIEHVAPYVHYLGAYPSAPLTQASAGPWRVDVRIQLRAPARAQGSLEVRGSWGGFNASLPLDLPASPAASAVQQVSLLVPAGAVALWWPAGLGQAALHSLTVAWRCSASGALTSSATRTLGFRHFAIVTGDDSRPALLSGRDGSGNLTVRWKVNGANLWSRGADVIPLEVLDGRSSDAAIRAMLQSAWLARMNTIRVDGIDLFFPDVFYDTCDALGLLIYHDMQYSQGNPAPNASSALQAAEITHTVRRLAHHPSLAVYDGCNECGGHGVYASFVMTAVAAEDASRPVWPSSPSNGWLSGVDALSSLPNGSPLGLQPTASQPVHAQGGGGRSHGSSQGLSARASARASAIALASAANAAAARGAGAGAGAGAGGCTFLPNLDVCPEDPVCLKAHSQPVASPQECCAACAAATPPTTCLSSVFFQGMCWFKPMNSSAPVASAGRVLCWPAGQPPPPMPTPGPMPPPAHREVHGPYVHPSGWSAVNGNPVYSDIGNGPIPPVFDGPYTMGVGLPSYAVSEFGCPASSSFESLAPTLAAQHWGVHGGMPQDHCVGGFARNCTGPSGQPENRMAQRNYPVDSLIGFYFGKQVLPSLDDVGVRAFQRQLYFALMAPALQQQSHVMFWRSSPTYMMLFWQLAEIWPTTGWGSLEYGTASGLTAGQVVGGRWKPLHYWLMNSLLSDVFAAVEASGLLFVRNDNPLAPFEGTLTVTALSTLTGLPVGGGALSTMPISLPPGAAAITWQCLGQNSSSSSSGVGGGCADPAATLASAGCAANGTDCLLRSTLTLQATGEEVLRSTQLWALPSALRLALGVTVQAAVGGAPGDPSLPITLTVQGGAAVLVMLTSGAAGRFSDNAMVVLSEGQHVVQFLPMLPGMPLDRALLASTLRVEHLAMYQQA